MKWEYAEHGIEVQFGYSALTTPSGFSNFRALKIATVLSALVADAFTLCLKTKNFHWHMSGPHFREYHLFFDDQAEQIYASIDPLAEWMRKILQAPLRSIGHVVKLTNLETIMQILFRLVR